VTRAAANSALPFVKMHGAGNDFVVLDGLRAKLPPLPPLARQLADRRRSVGFDQLLVLLPAQNGGDFRMQIYNADGSEAEMCANGLRCFFEFLQQAGHSSAPALRVETLAGIAVARRATPAEGVGQVCVQMGPPRLAAADVPTTLGGPGAPGPLLDLPLEVEGQRLQISALSMGNPHCIVFVPDVEQAPVSQLGPAIEHHPAFPQRTNVAFAELRGRALMRQRTWERGVGETLACGSAACAVAVAGVLRGALDEAVRIELPGGALRIAWPHSAEGPGASVQMTGPAHTAFRGEIAPLYLAADGTNAATGATDWEN